ncbi:sacsin N-terminal ATP-binding-like domain-containing protein [Rubritalea spongiae]|uniref:Sacsin N-terminal ATP-binding-like domain-containing protein n=1 Tax=Rubritalea spongiae TaxID=430797 RepID=A0ABW5DY39_9BACT
MNATEWVTWLEEQEQLRCEEYLLRDGDRLIADYRQELQVKHDYEGRELLEMLQNAGDAAAAIGGNGRVRICLLDHGLLIANTGVPFSKGGIKSLQTANLSPKKRESGVRVGEKGLGFRSILNWSRTPIINSGSLRLVFDPTHSEKVLHKMMGKSGSLAEAVNKERGDTTDVVCPLLAFPAYSDTQNIEHQLNCELQRKIYEHSEQLRSEGFDTVVGMPFSKKGAYKHAEQQLDELPYEILLFVHSLAQVEIQRGDDPVKVWSRKELQAGRYHLLEDGEFKGDWKIYDYSDERVPVDLLEDGEAGAQSYQITIAVPMEGSSKKEAYPLYSFFPTEVEVPLPVVCHATLRLEENRKRPTRGEINAHILRDLAVKLVSVAELQSSTESPWSAIDKLAPKRGLPYPRELADVGFGVLIIEQAKKRRILPCLDGTLRKSSEVWHVEQASDSWLPVKAFGDIVNSPEEQRYISFINSLELAKLESDAFVERCGKVYLGLEARVRLIRGIVEAKLEDKFAFSQLLLDHTGTPVSEGSRTFLSEVKVMDSLPSWTNVTFIEPELKRELERVLHPKDVRDLQKKLKQFGAEEFSNVSVIRRLVVSAKEVIEVAALREGLVWRELVAWIYQLYDEWEDDSVVGLPKDLSIKLPNKDGEYVPAGLLYLSREYGLKGRMLEGLYGDWANDKLIADREHLGLPCNSEKVVSFLVWLGVADMPRQIVDKLGTSVAGFKDYVCSVISYPALFGDVSYSTSSDVETARVRDVVMVDGLSDILSMAPPLAILSWAAIDHRFEGWRESHSEHCKLTAKPYRAHNERRCSQLMPSAIIWMIANTDWLPSSHGEKSKPRDVMLPTKVVEALFPKPCDFEKSEKEELGLLEFERLRHAWERVGVSPGLDSLSRDEVYGLMNRLPDLSLDGKAAKSVYRWFLESEGNLYGYHGCEYQKFLDEGVMWASVSGESSYMRVKDLVHIDSEVVPRSMLKDVAVVDLPARVGGQKVKKLFGVENLTKSSMRQSLASYTLSVDSESEALYFEDVKPWLKQLRQSQVVKAEKLRDLDAVELKVCNELTLKLSIAGKEHVFEVDPWSAVTDSGCIFVKVADGSFGFLPKDLLAEAIGGEVARLFDLTSGDAYASIYKCAPEYRDALLRKMIGEDFQPVSDADLAVFKPMPLPQEAPKGVSDVIDLEESVVDESTETLDGDSEDFGGIIHNSEIVYPAAGPIQVEDGKHVITSSSERALVVGEVGGGSAGGGSRRSGEAMDGEECEKMAESFEKQQGRFPLRVGSIKGYNGARCDIFSFDTLEKRSAFEKGTTIEGRLEREMSLIDRFIEVKGRRSPGAAIELEGNELQCAKETGVKYYLYRISPDKNKVFKLTILNNPLSKRPAVSYKAVIQPNHTKEVVVHLISNKASEKESNINV